MIIAEYVVAIEDDLKGLLRHIKKEKIIRCQNCKFLKIPRTEFEDMWCERTCGSVVPEAFCCWAEEKKYESL